MNAKDLTLTDKDTDKKQQKDDKSAELGANVPESSSFQSTAQLPPILTPPEVKAPTPPVDPGLDIDLTVKLLNIPVSNKLQSVATPHVTEKLKRLFWDFSERIPKFTGRKEYINSLSQFELALVDRYNYLLVDIPKEIEPVFKSSRITSPKDMGVNIYDILPKLNATDYARTVMMLRALTVADAADVDKENVPVLMLQEEKLLYETFHQYWLRRTREVTIDEMWSWFKNFDDNFHYLAPLPSDLDRRFAAVLAPGPFMAYNDLLRENHMLWPIIVDAWKTIVRKHVGIPVDATTIAFKEMLDLLNIRQSRFSRLNNFPTQFDEKKGERFLRNLLVASLCGEFCELHYDINLEDFNLPQTFDCLLLKALVPAHLLSWESRIDIDNYLAKFFIKGIPGFNLNAYTWDEFRAKYRLQNYLTTNLTANVITGIMAGPTIDFLMSDPNGRGWGTGGQNLRVSLPPNSGKFMNRNNLWYVPLGGREMQHEESIHTQYERYCTFADFFRTRRLNFQGSDADFVDPIMRVMTYFSAKRRIVSNLVYYLDRCQKKLGLMSIAYPIDRVDPNASTLKVKLMIDAVGLGSALLLTKAAELGIVSFDFRFVRFGWAIHQWANEFVEKWHYVSQRFVRPYYTKKERLDKVISLVKSDPKYNKLMYNTIGSDVVLNIIKIPAVNLTRNELEGHVATVRRFFDAYHTYFGLADHLYFGVQKHRNNQLFSRYWSVDNTNANIVSRLGVTDLENLIQTRGLSKIMETARYGGKLIEFHDMPVYINTKRENGEVKQPNILNISTTSPVSFNDLDWFYTFEEDLIDVDTNNFVNQRDPEWHIDQVPFIIDGHTFLVSLPKMLEVRKKGFTEFEDFKLVARV